jgi:predicted MPP superfamily phosphohydrolase
MILFLIVILSVYFSINYYILLRGWQAMPHIPWIKTTYSIIGIFLLLSFIIGMLLESHMSVKMAGIFQHIGTTWLFALFYLLLSVLFFDILRLCNHWWNIFPSLITQNYKLVKPIAFFASIILTVSIFIIGNYNFNHPKIVNLNLKVNKTVPGYKQLKIVAASDLHFGFIIGKEQAQRYVNEINAQKPDLILLPGDIFDRDIRPVIVQNIDEDLRKLSSPLGVYAILGNHEHFENIKEDKDFLTKSNIKILQDSTVCINNLFYIIGRDDQSNRKRLPLNTLMQGIDHTKPIINLDHQPQHLEVAAQNGVDLQISGHTHDGQIWPFNYLVNAIYEIGHGYLLKNKTHIYVSSGLGIWGPLLRVGTQSEIVCITLEFNP